MIRSSPTFHALLVLLLATGAAPELRYADGAPCVRDYEEFTPLLHELGRTGRVVTGDLATRNVS